jgi:hypothetical protein
MPGVLCWYLPSLRGTKQSPTIQSGPTNRLFLLGIASSFLLAMTIGYDQFSHSPLQRKSKSTPCANLTINSYVAGLGFNKIFGNGKTKPGA